jgi:uncharacterized protein (DUF486 family)
MVAAKNSILRMAGILICEADAIFSTIVQNKWWRLLPGTILPERSSGSFSGYTTAAVQLENAPAADSAVFISCWNLTRMAAPFVWPVILLTISNVFMTFAWYGHLKFTDRPIYVVILASWLIAFVEYCFAVPANRYGHGVYSVAELKTIQEVITLTVFAVFSVVYLGESITLNHVIGFALICLGAFFIFKGPPG